MAMFIVITYFKFSSDKDWKHLETAFMILLFTSTTLLMLIANDSPMYLLAVGKRKKAFEVLKKIASWNNSLPVLLNHMHLKKIDTEDTKVDKRENVSLANGLRIDSKLLINFVLLLCIWSMMSITYWIN